MELEKRFEITAEDLVAGINWHGDHDLDELAVEKLANLNKLLSDTIQELYFKRLKFDEITHNQNNASAKKLAITTEELLKQVIRMAIPEENWDKVDKLFELN